jgi:hypothetical protein
VSMVVRNVGPNCLHNIMNASGHVMASYHLQGGHVIRLCPSIIPDVTEL